MTLKEWYEFNKPVLNIATIEICILKNSFNRPDTILEARVDAEHAVSLFGDMELKRLGITAQSMEHMTTFRFLLWPKDVKF